MIKSMWWQNETFILDCREIFPKFISGIFVLFYWCIVDNANERYVETLTDNT